MGLTGQEKGDQGMGGSSVRGRGLWPCLGSWLLSLTPTWIPRQRQPRNEISAGAGRLVTGPSKRMETWLDGCYRGSREKSRDVTKSLVRVMLTLGSSL